MSAISTHETWFDAAAAHAAPAFRSGAIHEAHSRAARREHAGEAAEGRTLRLFDFNVFDTTLAKAASQIVSRASAGTLTRVAFLNAHCINVSYRDVDYRHAVASADRVLADGSGLAIAARAFGLKLTDNVNGTDLFPLLCEQAAAAGVGIYLLGGADGIASRAAARMQDRYPGLRICGTHHGFIKTAKDEARLIEEINASGAGILLAGLGVPLQDLWLARNRDRLTTPVLIGVGGLFDYYSDRIPRAPALMRAAGVEWIWRLAMEPKRLARRYLLGNLEFLARLMWLRVGAFDARPQPSAA